MAIRREHVHVLELRKFKKNCIAHLPVRRETRTEFNFGHACLKKRNTGITDKCHVATATQN